MKLNNVYSKNDAELMKAIKEILKPLFFREKETAYVAVFTAFKDGIDRGLGGHNCDHGTATIGKYMAKAQPYNGTFQLYRILVD